MVNLKKRLAPVLLVCAIVFGSLLMTSAVSATGDPNALDQGDFTQQCKQQYGLSGYTAQLFGSNAYSWKCVYNYPFNTTPQLDIDINAYCMRLWGVWAETTNPSSPYSWRCQV